MKILITGAAGFIGYHVSHRLLDEGHEVVGIDNLNEYYEVSLKEARLARLRERDGFSFQRLDIAHREGMAALFAQTGPFDMVVHQAAQAGVRYSIDNPHAYADSNLVGFINLLEGCRHGEVRHLVYASSSSVYGQTDQMPFREDQNVDHPLSLYAATKKANELMAWTYSHLYGIPATGLRYFTVYGPWGRPDMALFKFTRAVLADEAIDVYNHGDLARDFTYIDDIVEGVVRVLGHGPTPDTGEKGAPHRLLNIGRGNPVRLEDFIAAVESATGREARRNMLPMQPGDVPITWADTTALEHLTGYAPRMSLEEGVRHFVDWYREYYGC